MKNSLAGRMFRRVSIAHGALILLTMLLPLLPRCTPKPKNVVTFFDLAGSPAPAPDFEPEPEETPEIEVKSLPKPKPKPEKKPAIKPVITNTPPKKVETNTPPKKAESKKPAVTNTPPKKAVTNAPAKPKTEAERAADIRQTNRVPAPGAKPSAPSRAKVDYSKLREALNSAAKGSGSGSGSGTSSSGSGSGAGGMYSPFAWYYDSVKQRMYSVWQQPSGTPIGLSAEATVRVERDGRVSLKSITRRSGNVPFDQSVQNALNATTSLPTPPPEMPRDIQIEFVIAD